MKIGYTCYTQRTKALAALICLWLPFQVDAQTASDNYVKVYKAQVCLTGDIDTINDKGKISETTVYYDGLGRELQTVARKQSPTGHDVVTFATYDRYSKKTISYLPYVSTQTNGSVKSTPLPDQLAFYQNLFGQSEGAAALSGLVLEHSELGRQLEQGAPGAAWQLGTNHTVKIEYLMNTSNEIFRFNYSSTTNAISLTPDSSYYQPNTLSCKKTIDEHQNDVLEFVDKEGRTVCKKVKASPGIYASTYYIYDDFGNLVVVIPPEGVKSIIDLLNQQ